jgi:hypothetical protein
MSMTHKGAMAGRASRVDLLGGMSPRAVIWFRATHTAPIGRMPGAPELVAIASRSLGYEPRAGR